jgi:uridine phosphorylase
MILGDIKNAPILEFDEDSAREQKSHFFGQGKKDFGAFEEVVKKGIDRCVIFLPRSFNECKEIYDRCRWIYDFKSASSISPVYLYDDKCLIALCPLGGPAAGNLIEELSFVGINKFIACGSCGCIVDGIDIQNTLFIPTEAIRDEGLSYHYIPAARSIETNKNINKVIEEALIKFNQQYVFGKTWTIDALYRETPDRAKRRVEEGAIGVEMECASLAAVCEYNALMFGSLFYFTDQVSTDGWNWRLYDKIELRTRLLKIVIDAIMSL